MPLSDTPRALSAAAAMFDSLRASGPYHCKNRCGQKVAMPGVCASCGAADNARREAEAIALRCTSAGIPVGRFGWVRGLDCPILRSRVARPAAIEAVRQLDSSVSAVLYGSAGCGKTTLAVGWSRDRLTAGRSVRFVAARTLRSVDTDRLDRDVIHHAVTARVLVLDDVGAEMAGAQSGGHLAALRSEGVRHVIETRHDRGLPTLITTGFDSKALGELYGAGVARRLYEDAKEAKQIIRCDAPAAK